MDSDDVTTRTGARPDATLRYADHPDAVIDLHLPPTAGTEPASLLVLVHGGFWRERYDRTHTRPLAAALAAEGLVVATPEYRRVGASGTRAGGWPVTADDVDTAVGALPGLLAGLGITTTRTTVTGHSAGGHLALWLASQGHPIDRVVALAPVGDLVAAAGARLGDGAVQALLGGEPADLPQVYAAADPAQRFAEERPPCEVVVVHGTADDAVPVANSRGLVRRHPWVRLVELPGVDHFAVIDPLSEVYPLVRAEILS